MAKTRYSLSDTFKALKNRKMQFMLLLGISSGLPFALTLGTLQAWMKESEVDLKTIALFAFLRLPFSLKFMWSPLMDRYSLPFLDRRRGWATTMQILIAVCLAGMALTNPKTEIIQLLVLTLFVNFFSASQDIVLDAYRREVLSEQELGLGVATFVNGYLLAARFISGAFALLLPKFVGWPGTYLIMGGMTLSLALVTAFAPKLKDNIPTPVTLRDAFIGPLKEFFSRREALTVLAFVVLYKLGDAMASTLTLPFILEKGFSKEEYVAIVKVWGLGATILGGFVGGHYAAKVGIIRSLWLMGFLQAISTVGFALLDITGKNNIALAGIIAFENLTAQMGTAAYAAFMATASNVRFTATQYALLTSLMAVPGTILGSRTGELASNLGWSGFFVFCALAAAPGIFLIPVMTAKNLSAAKDFIRKFLIAATTLAIVYALGASLFDIGKLVIGSK